MSPRVLFRRVAVAEAITWGLLIVGIVLKDTGVTPVAVQVFGSIHGIAFIAYCLTTTVVAVDHGWSLKRWIVGLFCSIPPFVTVAFDLVSERQGELDDVWTLQHESPVGLRERLAAWLVRNPRQGAAAGAFAVIFLTGVALMVGPFG